MTEANVSKQSILATSILNVTEFHFYECLDKQINIGMNQLTHR